MSNELTVGQFVDLAKKGRFFTVTFVKRGGDKEVRRMVCRTGVKKGVKGVGMSFDPEARGLLPVWDAEKQQYRMVSLDGLVSAHIAGRRLVWDDRQHKLVER